MLRFNNCQSTVKIKCTVPFQKGFDWPLHFVTTWFKNRDKNGGRLRRKHHAHTKETLGMRKKWARSRFQTGIIQQATPKDEQIVNYQFRWTLSYLSIIEYIKSEISILKKVAVLSQIIIEGVWSPNLIIRGGSVPQPPQFCHPCIANISFN